MRYRKDALAAQWTCIMAGTLCVVTVLGLPVDSFARVWDVPSEVPTIQAAIDSAAGGDTVAVATGTYYETLVMEGKALHLVGVGGAANTVLQGAGGVPGSGALLSLLETGPDVMVRGFTFRDGGDSTTYGGAIDCFLCSGTIMENIFVGNLGREGGAVSLEVDSIRVLGNEFRDNRALVGGGALSSYSVSALVQDNVFEANAVVGTPTYLGFGGGAIALHTASGSFEVRENILMGNTANQGGGAIVVYGGSPLIESNTIVANVLFGPANGDSSFSGAGLWFHQSRANVQRNIIALNQGGHGIQAVSSIWSPTLDCNDVWGNAWGEYRGVVPGPGDFSLDPLLCDYLHGNYGVAPDSPCLTGGPAACGLVGAMGVGCSEPLAADDRPREAGIGLSIRASRRPGGEVTVEIAGLFAAGASEGVVEVFDIRGARIWSREFSAQGSDVVRLAWPGENAAGRRVARGVYFLRVRSDGAVASTPVVLTR